MRACCRARRRAGDIRSDWSTKRRTDHPSPTRTEFAGAFRPGPVDAGQDPKDVLVAVEVCLPILSGLLLAGRSGSPVQLRVAGFSGTASSGSVQRLKPAPGASRSSRRQTRVALTHARESPHAAGTKSGHSIYSGDRGYVPTPPPRVRLDSGRCRPSPDSGRGQMSGRSW